MERAVFKQYVGPADIHDGTIEDVQHSGKCAEVKVRSYEGELIDVVFDGVTEVKANRPQGMKLHALVEYQSDGVQRSFSFANWDDDDDASLWIMAHDVRFR